MPRLNQVITEALSSLDDTAADVAIYAISLIDPFKWEKVLESIRAVTEPLRAHVCSVEPALAPVLPVLPALPALPALPVLEVSEVAL